MALTKLKRRARIKQRIRKVVSGTASQPRLSVYRSNKEIYAQLIDDTNGVTIASVSSRDLKVSSKEEAAKAVGKTIAEKATASKIDKISFDRNGYLYHGRVKVLADAAREAGLKF